MKKNELTIEYEINMELETLYTILDSIYDKNYFKYPSDVKDLIKLLLESISRYTNHNYKDYDIIKEENFKKITYLKRED